MGFRVCLYQRIKPTERLIIRIPEPVSKPAILVFERFSADFGVGDGEEELSDSFEDGDASSVADRTSGVALCEGVGVGVGDLEAAGVGVGDLEFVGEAGFDEGDGEGDGSGSFMLKLRTFEYQFTEDNSPFVFVV